MYDVSGWRVFLARDSNFANYTARQKPSSAGTVTHCYSQRNSFKQMLKTFRWMHSNRGVQVPIGSVDVAAIMYELVNKMGFDTDRLTSLDLWPRQILNSVDGPGFGCIASWLHRPCFLQVHLIQSPLSPLFIFFEPITYLAHRWLVEWPDLIFIGYPSLF